MLFDMCCVKACIIRVSVPASGFVIHAGMCIGDVK